MQDALFDTPETVSWVIPIDRYDRDLPPIVILGTDWKAAVLWGSVAVDAAGRLGPDATMAELYEATTTARHTFYAVTADRTRLDLEIKHHQTGGAHRGR